MVGENKTVAIVAMGLSQADYPIACCLAGGRHMVADETWTINATGGIYESNLCFIMDDMRSLKETSEASGTSVANWFKWISNTDTTIMTSKAYPEFNSAVEYPIDEVFADQGYAAEAFHYLTSTVAFAVAFAMWEKVSAIRLFGCDFDYAGANAPGEANRACVEFLLGRALERGIEVSVAGNSTLLGTRKEPPAQGATGLNGLYGYKFWRPQWEIAKHVERAEGNRGKGNCDVGQNSRMEAV